MGKRGRFNGLFAGWGLSGLNEGRLDRINGMNRIGKEGEEDVGFAVVEPTTGQKMAGWILKLFGLMVLVVAAGYFLTAVWVLLTTPAEFNPGRDWILSASLIALGGVVGIVVGSAMRALGVLLWGVVRFGDGKAMRKWGLLFILRDCFVVVGVYLLIGFLVTGAMGAWNEEDALYFGVGTAALFVGVKLNGVMGGVARRGGEGTR